MKLAIFLLVLLGVTYGADNLDTECSCHADNFLAWESDMRRCLSKTGPEGLSLDNCVEYDWSKSGNEGLVCTKCAPTHAIGHSGVCVEHSLADCIKANIDGST